MIIKRQTEHSWLRDKQTGAAAAPPLQAEKEHQSIKSESDNAGMRPLFWNAVAVPERARFPGTFSLHGNYIGI
jgi:hypothetical protein